MLYTSDFNSREATMIKREEGFSLVELLITMVLFVIVMAAASQIFIGLLTQFKQQSKIAETNIEGIIGLEILRQDIAHAGYGLPWNGLVTYSESTNNPFSLNDAPSGAPCAIKSRNNVDSYAAPNNKFNGSDYLVIKSVSVAANKAANKWTLLGSVPPYTKIPAGSWTPASENLASTDRVIVLSPGTTTERVLVVNGTSFSTTYNNLINTPWRPTDANETRMVYGINTADSNAPVRPFNRADYSIRIPAAGVPQRCAPNTGILYKATMDHDTAGNYTFLPLLDCVADMQVVFGLDQNENGTVNCYTNNLSTGIVKTGGATPQNIRNEVKEVRVYILAHEGQRDVNFTFNNFSPAAPSYIRVGESSPPLAVCEGGIAGRDFDLRTITNYLNYRWKVYTIAVKPNNLGS
jgi:prepilin-type N-terminal cleavage/methylation domain-containing protein